jgi:hypothetical protein
VAFRKHYLLTWGGRLYGNEQFSCSLRTAHPIGENDPSLYTIEEQEAKIPDLVTDLSAFHGSSAFNNQTHLDWVKFNAIGADGRYLNQQHTTVRFLGGFPATGTSTVYAAPQLSLAVSLGTAKSRGPGSRGRFFAPCPASANSVAFDGRIATPTTTGGFGLAVDTMLKAVNNWPGGDLNKPRLVVATPGGRGMPDGDNIPITKYAIGRVVDTQRRRRNALAEDYVFRSFS